MKVIGIRENAFQGRDGGTVEGTNIYCTYPMTNDKAVGVACERLYLSRQRMRVTGYTPAVGDEIEVSYNKYGKVSGISKVSK